MGCSAVLEAGLTSGEFTKMAQPAAGTEKAQTAIATDADPTRGMPYHDKLTGELKQAIMKRRVLERNIVGPPHVNLSCLWLLRWAILKVRLGAVDAKVWKSWLTDGQLALDDTIYKKEGEYLEDTPHGNVLTGFDNYIKSITSNAVGRRKQGVSENDRVFSRSSVRLADFMVWTHTPMSLLVTSPKIPWKVHC